MNWEIRDLFDDLAVVKQKIENLKLPILGLMRNISNTKVTIH